MPVTTVYATAAGRWERLDGTSSETPTSKTMTTGAASNISSGGPYSGGKWNRGFWTWIGATFPEGASVLEAILRVRCTTAGTPHNHPVAALADDPASYGGTELAPDSGVAIAAIVSSSEQSLDVTDVVSGWVTNPSTAYGFILDTVGEPNGTSHNTIEGYDTARVTIEYELVQKDVFLGNSNMDKVFVGDTEADSIYIGKDKVYG